MAVDRDPQAIQVAKARLGSARVAWLACSYADPQALAAIREFRPEFALFDLGVSTRQLDSDARGFSFRPGVPLDMRMAPGAGETAAELLNGMDMSEMARLFRDYGDERRAKCLAATIVRRRSRSRFSTSDDLVNAIRSALGPRTGPSDFARLFQAVRIAVNGEIEALETALPIVLEALVPGGVLAVISYHSVEDRAVKRSFREWSRCCVCPVSAPVCTCRGRPLGSEDPRKPIRPTAKEIADNPRARSARLRVFRKADAR